MQWRFLQSDFSSSQVGTSSEMLFGHNSNVEAIFLYPWAYIFRSLRWYGFGEMMLYIAILLVGYLYLWKKGALDWHK